MSSDYHRHCRRHSPGRTLTSGHRYSTQSCHVSDVTRRWSSYTAADWNRHPVETVELDIEHLHLSSSPTCNTFRHHSPSVWSKVRQSVSVASAAKPHHVIVVFSKHHYCINAHVRVCVILWFFHNKYFTFCLVFLFSPTYLLSSL